jgi:hypothetical protein
MPSIKRNHLRVALFSIFLISICRLTVTPGYSYQESSKTRSAPISKQHILNALKEKDEEKQLSPEMILCQVKRSGVDFRLTPEDKNEEDLRKAGAKEDLINEIKNNYLTPRPATTSDDLCLICRDKLQPISIFRLDNQEVTAIKIASKLRGMGCEVRVDRPTWLKKEPSPSVTPLVPPIIKYPPGDNDAKDYAKAIADFIKNETNIVLEPEPHPSIPKYHKKKLEVWLLQQSSERPLTPEFRLRLGFGR